MISFFRRALTSWLVLGLLGLIMIAFIVTGVGTPGGLEQLANTGNRVAKVGREAISAQDISLRIDAQYNDVRRENPELTMSEFLKQGALDQTINQLINSAAFADFARHQGMATSRRLVDAEIAGIQAFHGPTGQFDQATFRSVLDQRRIKESQLRDDIARGKLAQMLLLPAGAPARAPAGLVMPYASLLLERRQGQLLTFSAAGFDIKAPADAELEQFYQRNQARYTVPETRIVRYAVIGNERFANAAKPSEAEIAQAYKARGAEFAGSEKRTLTQVLVQSEAAAKSIAAAGASGLETAAKAAGAEAVKLAPQTQSAYAGLATPALAAQAFKAARGAIAGPAKSPLGWHVVRVDAIETTAGRSIEAVRPQLVQELSAKKVESLLADFVTKIEDEVADGATFDDVAKSYGLSVASTPPITASGIAPSVPGYKADPELAGLLKDAFNAEPDDEAAVVTIKAGHRYALFDLDRVVPAAPKPLAEIRAQVTADYRSEQANRAARARAEQLAAKINAGATLAAALADGGKPGASRPLNARRIDLSVQTGRPPAELAMLFSIANGKARAIQSADKSGWQLIYLERVMPGDARQEPGLIPVAQAQLGQALGGEFATQFANAIRAETGVKRYPDTIARLRKSLSGPGGQ